MRANFCMIAIALGLVAVCLFMLYTMHGQSHELMQIAHRAGQQLPEDPDSALSDIEQFAALWAKRKYTWQFLIQHEDIASITESLARVQHLISIGEIDEAMLECHLLPIRIEAILEKELPSLGNIF